MLTGARQPRANTVGDGFSAYDPNVYHARAHLGGPSYVGQCVCARWVYKKKTSIVSVLTVVVGRGGSGLGGEGGGAVRAGLGWELWHAVA
jgi:hypothetical protein